MDEYQHPLFFEARELTDKEKVKIMRHFQKKRDSGGGDCGMIEKAGNKTYKICFKEKEDQERVLHRKFHTISFSCGELRLAVSQTNSLHNSKATDLPSTSHSQKEYPVVEKQFKLVEEEFSREMRAHCPEIKIIRGNVNTIILEGPDKEVQSGATKLEELINKIKEKRIMLPTDLMTFMTSSSVISKYQARFQQTLRNPVDLEVGSDLVLSSLSSEALDDAKAAVLKDLSVEIMQLQGSAAIPPDLDKVKEILIKAKNEANLRELRVDVSFIPVHGRTAMTKVRLVGYSENVNKLKEILQDYQINQVGIQEVLNLPNPDMIDDFDKILGLIGMKQTKVTLKASHFPYPCVLVSGPRCLVQEAQQALMSALASLTSDTLVLDGPGAQQYFQGEGKVSKELVESSFKVLIKVQQGVRSIGNPSPSSVTPRPSMNRRRCSSVGSMSANKTNLEINLGSLVDQQVDVLVVPMLKRKLTSTKIGKCLLSKAGNTIRGNFDLMAANCTLRPGDVLQVDGPPSLGCSKILFIECLPWDGVSGQSVQALGNGLKRCLDLCVQQGLCSVAFPVIGPGIILKYPLSEAIQALTENIRQFGLSASSGSLTTIRIVIKPDYPDSEECYQDVYSHLSLNMKQGGRAIFRSLTCDLDDITITVGGGVKLQLVFKDIAKERTDAVLNTTDFINFNTESVCKDILTLDGLVVGFILKNAEVNQGDVFRTPPGQLPCKAILHACGEKDAGFIEQLVCRIIQKYDSFGYKSVDIPAVCAESGELDPGVAAHTILRGVKAATSSTPPHCLTNIRFVLNKINVFLAFKQQTMQMFPTVVINTVSVPQLPYVPQQQPLLFMNRTTSKTKKKSIFLAFKEEATPMFPTAGNRAPVPQFPDALQQQPPLSMNADLSILRTSSTSQRSIFWFLGLSRKDVDDAMTKLKNLYEAQCSTQTFRKAELEVLTQDDMNDLKQLVKTLGLYMQENQSGQGGCTVSGLKDRVSQVIQMIRTIGPLRREVRVREEEDLNSRVVWCIMGHRGDWERLPKTANHILESGDVIGGIEDAEGVPWSVNLQRMEAKRRLPGQTAKLKRLENLSDFILPLYWDNMATDENLKVVALQPSSAEYQTVKEAFKRTVTRTVMKIERLQNVHLRRAYEFQKKHISDNNGWHRGAMEKLLYHGTTQDNSDAIMKTGFNRRFAGQNATAYGQGTYFAVRASYSANPTYSKPATDGSQLMFVARVLTGIYTQGRSNMKVPPPLSDQQPHERYDSVVDNIDNPKMYVVFHDNQAYPDYLITFK